MKNLFALILIVISTSLFAQKRVVYEIDTTLQTIMGFELSKSIVLVDKQFIVGNPPKLGFDLSSYSDTVMYQAEFQSLVLKSAKTDKHFTGYSTTLLDSTQLANFCLPNGGFISVYKSIIANELEVSEDKISVYECSIPTND